MSKASSNKTGNAKIKRHSFIANTRQEAILQAQIDIGSDFDIVNQTHVQTGGFLGLFTKKQHKVTIQTPSKKKIKERARRTVNSKNKTANEKNSNKKTDESVQKMQKYLMSRKQNNKDVPGKFLQSKEDEQLLKKIFSNIKIAENKKENSKIINNINNVGTGNRSKDIFDKMNKEINEIKNEILNLRKTVIKNPREQSQSLKKRFLNCLIKNDFPKVLANTLLNKFEKTLNKIQLEDRAIYQKKFREYIIEHIYYREGIDFLNDDIKKIALIGPTGVGKTTTIAKLAYYFSIECEKKVKVVSVDVFKYGGINQLEDLCSEMDINFSAVYEMNDYEKEINDKDYDVILIDTSGKNYNDSKNITEIKAFCKKDDDIEKYLVVSAESKYSDMIKLNKNFSSFGIKGTIFTKCDLTRYFGAVVAFLVKSKNSVVYMTFSKKIDNDLKEAVPYKLVDGILGAEIE
ncbi:MAG: AAA family ATPase [Candidatus Muiribacteriota bacterium]